jgi:N-acetylglucosaminyl-diphospho-decaprenol L-rhamnosyltransferase
LSFNKLSSQELSLVDVSIVLISYNTAEMTIKAISLVMNSIHQLEAEIFVIDNASKDNSVSLIKSTFPDIHLIENSINVGFGRANNQVLPLYKGQYVLLLNTDAFVEPDTIQRTYDFMQANPRTGVLGVKLLGRDGVLQPSCRYFPTPLNIFLISTGLNKIFSKIQLVDDMSWSHCEVRDCDWVPGCYYLIRKEVIDNVGLFDPRYFLYYEEVDHCFATKQAGWNVTYFPDTPVVHVGGESAKTDNKISSVSRQVSALQIESEFLYFRKNLGLMKTLLHFLLFIVSELVLFLKRLLKNPLDFKKVFNFKSLFLFFKIAYLTSMGARSLH